MIEACKLKIGDTIEIEGRIYEAMPEESPCGCLGCDFDTVDVLFYPLDCSDYISGCLKGNVIFKLKGKCQK